jgi:hypothetical protein
VTSKWPGAFFSRDGVRYISVAGRAVEGDRGGVTQRPPTFGGMAHNSYLEVWCGCVCVGE